MDSSLWDQVISELSFGYPVRGTNITCRSGRTGAPSRASAGLSLPRDSPTVAAEFIERLGLRDVTLASNDTGGALICRCSWPTAMPG